MIEIRHDDPATGNTSHNQLKDVVYLGRDPGPNGLHVGSNDQTVSSRAVTLTRTESGLLIHNSSSFSECEISLQTGLRIIFPGESIVLQQSCELRIPGEIYSYRVKITIDGESFKMEAGETGTRRIVESVEIHPERWPVAVCLCSHRFFPERFGTTAPNATEIVKMLDKLGVTVTPKAVNHKIQRLREDLGERNGQFLDTRDDLVDFLVRQRAVTRSDVQTLLAI